MVREVVIEAMNTQGNGQTCGAAVPGTKDAGTGKFKQSNAVGQKLPMWEQVDREREVEDSVDAEKLVKKAGSDCSRAISDSWYTEVKGNKVSIYTEVKGNKLILAMQCPDQTEATSNSKRENK